MNKAKKSFQVSSEKPSNGVLVGRIVKIAPAKRTDQEDDDQEDLATGLPSEDHFDLDTDNTTDGGYVDDIEDESSVNEIEYQKVNSQDPKRKKTSSQKTNNDVTQIHRPLYINRQRSSEYVLDSPIPDHRTMEPSATLINKRSRNNSTITQEGDQVIGKGTSLLDMAKNAKPTQSKPSRVGSEFHEFLEQYRAGSKSDFPSLSVTNSMFGQDFGVSIPEQDYKDFLDKFTEALKKEEPFCLDERVEDFLFKMFLDIDIKVNSSNDTHREIYKDISPQGIVSCINKRVADFFPRLRDASGLWDSDEVWDANKAYYDETYRMWYPGWPLRSDEERINPFSVINSSRLRSLVFICTRKSENNGPSSIGIHMYWPGILVDYKQGIIIAENIKDALKKRFGECEIVKDSDRKKISIWDSAIDTQVYNVRGSGMRMIGTEKYGSCSRCKGTGNYVYSSNDGNSLNNNGFTKLTQITEGTSTYNDTASSSTPKRLTSHSGKKKTGASLKCPRCNGERGMYNDKVYEARFVVRSDGFIEADIELIKSTFAFYRNKPIFSDYGDETWNEEAATEKIQYDKMVDAYNKVGWILDSEKYLQQQVYATSIRAGVMINHPTFFVEPSDAILVERERINTVRGLRPNAKRSSIQLPQNALSLDTLDLIGGLSKSCLWSPDMEYFPSINDQFSLSILKLIHTLQDPDGTAYLWPDIGITTVKISPHARLGWSITVVTNATYCLQGRRDHSTKTKVYFSIVPNRNAGRLDMYQRCQVSTCRSVSSKSPYFPIPSEITALLDRDILKPEELLRVKCDAVRNNKLIALSKGVSAQDLSQYDEFLANAIGESGKQLLPGKVFVYIYVYTKLIQYIL